ncbi:uncharacterized protein G2W53_014219 [Senna tora]|uniref:Uncharacterized protein n=1 Tax=Senna tora TaxID=362788 RepID=A0A835C611_9FABA|nr:uncharacterized protein G2W53_014219 [Senna tora]
MDRGRNPKYGRLRPLVTNKGKENFRR